jgi:hypothetical protein
MKFASYTKNRIPHKALGGKSPLEILQPVTDIIAERSNLRKFGGEVIVHNYGVTDKMAARSHRGHIIGYTNTYGVYWTIDKNQKRALAKDPKPIQDDKTKDLEISGIEGQPEDNPDLEPAIPKSPAKISSPVEPIAISAPAQQKLHRKTPQEFTALYGSRESTRTKRPTHKLDDASSKAVGIDPDYPTDQQARQSQYNIEWANAREKECTQLRTYGVYTVVKDIPEGDNTG